ncbi:MAG: hypothetical protein JJE47_14865 [Acidimicrobiia bacterium]|nr:hypothetical protein [Acidimicrobiia bacterium]
MHRTVRAFIYGYFRDEAAAPTVATIADRLSLSTSAVQEALEGLAEAHAIVLQPGTHTIWMAHPFSGIPTDYTASVADRTWFANCGWDSIAILALLGDGTFASKDPLTGATNQWTVTDGTIVPDGVVHFLVPARQFWDDIGYT